MKTERPMWTTTVGSHMWGMNHPGSDMDLFEVYIQDTELILAGHRKLGGIEVKYDNVDLVRHEIGHVVSQLQKGNVNFLWGVMSPIVEYPIPTKDRWSILCKELHKDLIKLITDNLSKNYLHSVTGLVRANLSKYYGISVSREDNSFRQTGGCKIDPTSYKYHKKIRLMFRTLMQGYLLLKCKIEFPNVEEYEPTLELLETLYKDTIMAYNWSELPEKPDQAPFDDYLVRTRVKILDF